MISRSSVSVWILYTTAYESHKGGLHTANPLYHTLLNWCSVWLTMSLNDSLKKICLVRLTNLPEWSLTCDDSHGQTYSNGEEERTNVKYGKPDCPTKSKRQIRQSHPLWLYDVEVKILTMCGFHSLGAAGRTVLSIPADQAIRVCSRLQACHGIEMYPACVSGKKKFVRSCVVQIWLYLYIYRLYRHI